MPCTTRLGLLLALRQIPVVARTLAAPGMVSRLELPHSFRGAEGAAFLATMALGHLPALFALPARPGRHPRAAWPSTLCLWRPSRSCSPTLRARRRC